MSEPVTIEISVSVGTFEASLDGQPFSSGATVSEPGGHTLVVEARNGDATATETVSFEIGLQGALLIVRFFDLGANAAGGGGDAILVSDSAPGLQRHMLIDAGPAGANGSDVDFVEERLQDLGVDTLEAMLLTHAHTDHFDGMPAVLRGLHVRTFYHNDQVRPDFGRYNEFLDLAASRAESSVVVAGQTVELDLGGESRTDVTVVPPLADHLGDPDADASRINDGSIGTALARGSFRMFFTGDGEVDANTRWRTDFADLTADLDVLKVGHHGANDAVLDVGGGGFVDTSSWLDHTDPEIQVISANGTSHPRVRALNLLLGRSNSATYCTNVHGDITLRVDEGGQVAVTVEKNADMDCEPGEDATT